MKELTDEEIQALIEAHQDVEPSEDVKLYHAVFSELSSPIHVSTGDLAAQVILEVYDRTERRASIKTYALVTLSLVAGILALITGVFRIDSAGAEILKDRVYQLKWTIVFLCGMLALIAAIEKKLNTSLRAKRI